MGEYTVLVYDPTETIRNNFVSLDRTKLFTWWKSEILDVANFYEFSFSFFKTTQAIKDSKDEVGTDIILIYDGTPELLYEAQKSKIAISYKPIKAPYVEFNTFWTPEESHFVSEILTILIGRFCMDIDHPNEKISKEDKITEFLKLYSFVFPAFKFNFKETASENIVKAQDGKRSR